MCRALLYLGQPVLLDHFFSQPDSSLVKQSYLPKMLHTSLRRNGSPAITLRELD